MAAPEERIIAELEKTVLTQQGGKLTRQQVKALALAQAAAAWLSYLETNPATADTLKIAAQFQAALADLEEGAGQS